MRASFRAPSILVAAAIVAAGLLPGCTPAGGRLESRLARGSGGQHEGETPIQGGVARISVTRPGNLDPVLVDDVYEAAVVNQIYDGLFAFDHELKPAPALASSWTLSPDRRTYVFSLRPGVRFHDGTILTAADVVASFARIFDPDGPHDTIATTYLEVIRGAREYQARRAPRIAGLEAIGELEVRITLDQPAAHFLAMLCLDQAKIVSRSGGERGYPVPAGSGPFELAGWEGEILVLEAFDGCWAGRPFLDRAEIYAPEYESAEQECARFHGGELDLVEVPFGRLFEFYDRPEVEIVRQPELAIDFLGFNVRQAPFKDPRVRRAFLLAIDRSRALAFEPENRRLPTGILPPGLPGYSPVPRVPLQDRDEAARLLAAAGHPNGRGLPELEVWVSEPGEMRRCLDQLLVADLRQVGIRARVREVRWSNFDSLLAAGAMPMFCVSWMADLPDPDAIFRPLFHSRGSCNFFGYSNPEVDRLLEATRGEQSAPRRYELFRQAEEHILADAPLVPLDHLVTCFAVRTRVHGLHMNALGLSQLHLREVWVEPAPAGRGGAPLAD